MERCNFWKNRSKNLLCWQGLVLLDWSWQVRTCPNHDFWSNLARFGFKIRFLTKFLDDSAWFLLEKLKKHVILTKNPNIWSTKFKNTPKISKNINVLNCPPWYSLCWTALGRAIWKAIWRVWDPSLASPQFRHAFGPTLHMMISPTLHRWFHQRGPKGPQGQAQQEASMK